MNELDTELASRTTLWFTPERHPLSRHNGTGGPSKQLRARRKAQRKARRIERKHRK